MSRFYLTLPSNSSMDYYPENTLAHYTTKLNSVIELDGEWEIGLTEISIPSHVHNVIEGQCYYDLYIAGVHIRRINVTPGHYRRMRDLVEDLHRSQRAQVPLQSHEPLLVEFSFDTGNKRVRMTCEDSLHQHMHVEFNANLARLLGYHFDVRYSLSHQKPKVSKFPPNLTGNIQSVYVYCDLGEHVLVGDTKAPLLRIVDRTSDARNVVHRTFNPPLYIPLQKKCFDTVEINLMTDTGIPVPFLSGKSFVVMEFRLAAYKYFAM